MVHDPEPDKWERLQVVTLDNIRSNVREHVHWAAPQTHIVTTCKLQIMAILNRAHYPPSSVA